MMFISLLGIIVFFDETIQEMSYLELEPFEQYFGITTNNIDCIYTSLDTCAEKRNEKCGVTFVANIRFHGNSGLEYIMRMPSSLYNLLVNSM
jgi:hypothetical protein